MKIYLDFDDTIFDTAAFVDKLTGVWMRAGFSEADFDRAYLETKARANDFDMEILIQVFGEQKSFDEVQTRRRLEKLLADAGVFVYADFFDFARRFTKADLKMLSFGTTQFQWEKIESSGVVPFFSELIITPQSKEKNFADIVAAHPAEPIFFVEDRADQVDKVKKVFPQVTTFKIERPSGRHRKTHSLLTDFKVQTLSEAAEIIETFDKK